MAKRRNIDAVAFTDFEYGIALNAGNRFIVDFESDFRHALNSRKNLFFQPVGRLNFQIATHAAGSFGTGLFLSKYPVDFLESLFAFRERDFRDRHPGFFF